MAFTFCSPAEPAASVEEVAATEQPAGPQPQLPDDLFNAYIASQVALAGVALVGVAQEVAMLLEVVVAVVR